MRIDSPYYSTSDIPNHLKTAGHFNILHLNIQSFSNKHINELDCLLQQLNISCIVATESWLNDASKDTVHFNNFKEFHLTRASRRGGGVSIFIHKTFAGEKLDNFTIMNESLELVGVKVSSANFEATVLGIYRPPNTNINEFFRLLEAKINQCGPMDNIFFCGDTNIDLLKINTNNHANALYNLFVSNSFYPCITRATRLNKANIVNSSLLDQIFIRASFPISSIIISEPISDHLPTLCHCNLRLDRADHTIRYRLFDENNAARFIVSMRESDFSFAGNPVVSANDQFNIFSQTILENFNSSFPIIEKRISDKRFQNPWMTAALLTSVKRKNHLYKLYKQDLLPYPFYSYYRNKLNKLISTAKSSHYHVKIENNSNNPKKQWTIINEILNKKRHVAAFPSRLDLDEETATQPQSIVNKFNEYFSQIGNITASKVPQSPVSYRTYLSPPVQSSFEFFNIYFKVTSFSKWIHIFKLSVN